MICRLSMTSTVRGLPRNSKLWQPCGQAIVDLVVFLGMLVDFFAKDPFRGKANMPNSLLSNFVHAHKQISFFDRKLMGHNLWT